MTNNLTTEQLPVMGRCKGCDYTLFSDAADIRAANTLNDVVAGAAFRMTDRGNFLGRCPSGHKVFRLHKIEGEYSDKHTCNAQCLNAVRNKCVCSCGGMNHGRGHAGAPLDNVSVPRQGQGPSNPYGYPDRLAEAIDDERQITDGEAEAEALAETYEAVAHNVLFGEVGDTIRGKAQVTHKQDVNDATLYLFRAYVEGQGFGTIKWFKPSYVNVPYAKGDSITFTAKVKRHETEYGNATLVTYFEGAPRS